MEKPGKKVRDVRFFSAKNQVMMLVHSEEARAYSKYLESRDEVEAYEVCKEMDEGRLKTVSRIDIRGEYFDQPWSTDFYIKYVDGTIAIREVVRSSDLEKRAEVEKLELSRRYWSLYGIGDWKVVSFDR